MDQPSLEPCYAGVGACLAQICQAAEGFFSLMAAKLAQKSSVQQMPECQESGCPSGDARTGAQQVAERLRVGSGNACARSQQQGGVLRSLRGRAFGTKEVVDVLREQVRIGHHRVIGRIVFCSCGDDALSGLHVGDKFFDLRDLLSGLLSLLDECILNSAGVAVQQGRGFNSKWFKPQDFLR